MKKVNATTTPKKQRSAEQRKARRVKRQAKLKMAVEKKVKGLTRYITNLNDKLQETQNSLQESMVKVADLTKENVNLKKATQEEVKKEKETK